MVETTEMGSMRSTRAGIAPDNNDLGEGINTWEGSMDKLKAIYLLARKLDQAADEELLAKTPSDKAKARARMIEAEAEYVRALDALHDGKAAQGIDCGSVA